MKRLHLIIANGLFVLILYLVFTIAILIVVEMQPVRADTLAQPTVNTTVNASELYQPLTNAAPQRNITRQQFAPPAPTHQ